jgi:hypothetical protein
MPNSKEKKIATNSFPGNKGIMSPLLEPTIMKEFAIKAVDFKVMYHNYQKFFPYRF